MKKERIFIGLGSNIEDKHKNIQTALELMEANDIKIIKTSSLIITEPYGYKDQDHFLNGVVEVEFAGSPEDLLKILLSIESKMKRKRTIRWGPRIIDLDILLWGEKIIKQENLVIPHPDMHNREFVLKPLAEIAPEFIHPILHLSISEMLAKNKLLLNNRA